MQTKIKTKVHVQNYPFIITLKKATEDIIGSSVLTAEV